MLTAVHEPNARFLADAWRSLRAQDHTDWTWFVQLDGAPEPMLDALKACGAAADPRVEIDAHLVRVAPANARNLALARGDAPLVQNLDGDDLLEPSALTLLSTALAAVPEAGYAAGRARDLHADGSLRDVDLPLKPGIIPPGAIADAWRTSPEDYRVPLHPAGVMWRRDAIRAGWPALHGMEDTGLLIMVARDRPGILLDAPTLRYRLHPGQSSREPRIFAGGGHQITLLRRLAG
ncbi:glycosyltransferase family 2 protein [Actinocorallia lasiicapitis]